MAQESKKTIISRRVFIRRATAGTAAMMLTPFNSLLANTAQSSWLPNAHKYRIRMIGHGHIDPVWLWRWHEGVSVVHSTFRSALERMKENSGMVFTCSSALFYQWVSENDPKMLEEVRKRVKEGRWNVVGGWWVEPDMNIPCGEAMVRQGLYGQLTLQRLLGVRAKVGFNPDSFGHTGTLPQILKKQGMENYVFMRPGPREKTIPADLFWWEAPDGSRVLTYRIQNSYNEANSVMYCIPPVLEAADKQPMKTFMAFYGVGDHGGGPTKINLRTIEEIRQEKNAPAILYSSVDAYFEEVRADKSLQLPTIKDDLQRHAVGCYTSECEIKKGNRLSESALITCEKVTSLGSFLWGVNYPSKQLTSAWEKILFLQFHDSLAGSSLVSHSQDAREGYGYVLDIAHNATYLALQKLEWQIASEDPEYNYWVVFNPHAWDIKAYIKYDTYLETKFILTTDGNNDPLPHQWVLGESQTGKRAGLVVAVNVPAIGYQQIRIQKGEPVEIEKPVKAEGHILENEFYKIQFSTHGTLGITNKENNEELFSGGLNGCKGIIIEDTSDAWGHNVTTYDKEIGAFDEANIKILESGPLKATTRVVSTYGNSRLVIDWTLFSGSRNIEANVMLDWHEKMKMLKFSFPVNVDSPVVTYEVPYGFIERELDGYENPGQRWIDITGEKQNIIYGLTVINDAKYGYNTKENDMRISIVRSAVFAHHDPKKLDPDKEYVYMDQGIQTFRMMLVPHKGSWKEANIARIAEEFISQPIVIYQGIHPGHRPKSASFLSVDQSNIVISSVKKSETGNDLIIRCVETNGLEVKATLQLPLDNKIWTGDFIANEIKTLRYNFKNGTIREVNLLEE